MAEHDALIGQYTHEKHRPRADVALVTLKRIASMVKPIMRQRGWHVGKLSEFYPDQDNLLGLNYNRGQRICIRLRYPNDQTLFMPFEALVDTMLHELAHNVVGPHNDRFHALWNELRDEYEALLMKGYTGEGFLSPGQRLGGRGHKPIHEARRLARAAAENRRHQHGAGGSKRLGGAAPSNMVDIRQTIADAAQRRRDILKGCASTTEDDTWKDKLVEETQRNEFQTMAEIDDADMRAIEQAFMEMVQEDEERTTKAAVSSSNTVESSRPPDQPDRAKISNSAATRPPRSLESGNSRPSRGDSHRSTNQPPAQTSTSQLRSSTETNTWTCQICTFENPSSYLCCGVCLIERPSDPGAIALEAEPSRRRSITHRNSPPGYHKILRSRASLATMAKLAEAESKAVNAKPIGWSCHGCGNFMESQWWTCSSCGAMKLQS